MTRETGGLVGTCGVDNLIADIFPPTIVMTIDLKTKGVYERGTVMSIESDGTYEVLGSGSGAASCVIAEDTIAEDEIATAYRSGHFYRNGLVLGEYELTAADEDNLRKAGILLSDGI